MWVRVLLATAVGLGSVTLEPPTGELRPDTLAAFDRYVRLTETRIAAERSGSAAFLWLDRQPSTVRANLLTRLKRGEVLHERLQTRDAGREIEAPGGLIHHWIGIVQLPGASAARTRAFVQRYDQYPVWFGPMVMRAAVIAQTGDRFTVRMRTSMKAVLTVVMDADYRIDYQSLGEHRFQTTSVATNIYEVKAPGEADERRIPTERSSGYLWRMNTYCSFETIGGDTFEQCESISLSRGIPFGLGPLIRPYVNGIPRDALAFTLGRVRSGLARG